MSQRTDDEIVTELVFRALDGWFLAFPEATLNVVEAWLESVNVEVVDPVLEAQIIDET